MTTDKIEPMTVAEFEGLCPLYCNLLYENRIHAALADRERMIAEAKETGFDSKLDLLADFERESIENMIAAIREETDLDNLRLYSTKALIISVYARRLLDEVKQRRVEELQTAQ